MRLLALSLLAFAIAAVPALAQAQDAYTAKPLNLRAGPAREYPVVAVLPAGLKITVQGCLADYSWCDVAAGPHRGWGYAGNINYFYQNTYVPVLNYGRVIGLGEIVFILDEYWGEHYRDRPWYQDRQRWAPRPAQPRPRVRRPPSVKPPPPSPPPTPAQPRPHEPVPLRTRPHAASTFIPSGQADPAAGLPVGSGTNWR